MRPRLPPRKSGPILELAAFKDPKYTGFLTGSFFVYWANYYTFYYVGPSPCFVLPEFRADERVQIASYGVQVLNLPYSSASLLVVIINGVGFPVRILIPMVSDRFGNLNVIVPLMLIWTIVTFAWLAVHDISGYYAFTVVYGMVSAGFQCLFPSTVARITPRLDTIGTRLGMAFGIAAIASLTGPPIGGAIQVSSGGSFKNSQIWAATVTLVSFLLLAAVRLYIGGLSLKVKC
jgi:MFS-type transporter involved in bile tolerance (Atg22 family)